jgi:hypothetical protein
MPDCKTNHMPICVNWPEEQRNAVVIEPPSRGAYAAGQRRGFNDAKWRGVTSLSQMFPQRSHVRGRFVNLPLILRQTAFCSETVFWVTHRDEAWGRG